jgi:hypothetical protein
MGSLYRRYLMHDPLDQIELEAILNELEAMDYIPDDDCHMTYWEE